MLYVSRFRKQYGSIEVGVVDTDDNKEEFISYNQLLILTKTGRLAVTGCYYNGISPWQPDKEKTRLQQKMSIVHGIDIKVYKDMITHFDMGSWSERNSFPKTPVPIIVSDFGHELCDLCFVGNSLGLEFPMMTLVFDDTITVSSEAFYPVINRSRNFYKDHVIKAGVQIDVRQVRNGDKAQSLYARFGASRGSEVMNFIIDRESRKSAFISGLLDFDIKRSYLWGLI